MMIDLAIVLTLIALGYFVGSYLEKRHYISIKEREAAFASLPSVMLKNPLKPERVKESRLVNGSVVISIDYFKRVMAAIISIFGGDIGVYESLLDRARREAILRMKEDAEGADEIINIRIETASIYKNDQKGSIGSVEVLAYGTALTY